MGSVIGFAGLSHLGIVSSLATAAQGFDVVAYDANPDLVARLQAGCLPVHEPGLPELLRENAARMTFTAAAGALFRCGVVVVSIDIPTNSENQSDLTVIDRLLDGVIAELAPGSVLVILSQVRPGYTRSQVRRLHEVLARRHISLYYQVETLVFGRAVERALHPERFIIGCADPRQSLPAAYQELLSTFGCPLLPMRYESAELAKIAINIFLTASVTAANSLAEVCEKIGADWGEVVPALRLDKRIGPFAYLSPGLGLAGGNLERDLETVKGLACEHGTDARVIDAYVGNSHYRRDWVLRKLHAHLAVAGRPPVLAVWGLAYKPNTHSTKNSSALALIRALRGIRVQAYDPEVTSFDQSPPDCQQHPTPLEACAGADALAIMTPWPQFGQVDLTAVRAAMGGRLLIDPFGCLDGHAAGLGFSYFKLGYPAQERSAAA
jgi:UDPglucose 6-dehydrogenase